MKCIVFAILVLGLASRVCVSVRSEENAQGVIWNVDSHTERVDVDKDAIDDKMADIKNTEIVETTRDTSFKVGQLRRQHVFEDLHQFADNDSSAKVGPAGTRRFFMYALICFAADKYLPQRPRLEMWQVQQLTLAHAMHPDGTRKTLDRAERIFEWLQGQFRTGDGKMKLDLNEGAVNYLLGSDASMWGLPITDSEFFVINGNGRAAALMWASMSPAFIDKTIRIPVFAVNCFKTDEAWWPRFLSKLINALYTLTDQGPHMSNMLGFWKTGGGCDKRCFGTTGMESTDAECFDCMQRISFVDDGIPKKSENVSQSYPGWETFIQQVKDEMPDLVTEFSRAVAKKHHSAVYWIDCFNRHYDDCLRQGFNFIHAVRP